MAAWQRIALLLLVGLAFVLGTSWAGAQKADSTKLVQKWELTKVDRGTEGWKEAQRMAGDGWELVAVDVTAFYLKRPK